MAGPFRTAGTNPVSSCVCARANHRVRRFHHPGLETHDKLWFLRAWKRYLFKSAAQIRDTQAPNACTGANPMVSTFPRLRYSVRAEKRRTD